MYTRQAYISRIRKTQRLKKRVAVAALVGVGGCVAALALVREPGLARAAASDVPDLAVSGAAAAVAPVAVAAGKPATRRIYPYSVVPGGVADGADVRRMVRMDKVVAEHYASFDVDKARAVTVEKPRAVYVSYRKGDKIYWSAAKHTLAAGETVLSDGQNEIRGRCGNRISDTAQFPVEPHGPSERELDTAAETQDPSAGGLQNVSFGLDGGPGGQSWQLTTFPNDAGLARAAAEAQARRGIGLPEASGGLDLPLDASRLLADLGGSAGAGTPPVSAPGAPDGAPAGTSPVDTPAISPSAPAGGQEGNSAPSHPGAGNGDHTGNTGGATPGDGPGAPDPVSSPGGGQPTLPGGGPGGTQPGGDLGVPPGVPPGIPEVLLPTDPVTPVKPAEPVKGGAEVPEPGTLWLSGLAFAALLLARRRKR